MLKRKLTITESIETRNRIFKAFVVRIKRVYEFKQSTFKDAVYGKNPENGGYTYEFISLWHQLLEFLTVDIPASDNEIHIIYNSLLITPPIESIDFFKNISKEKFYSAETTARQYNIAPTKWHGLTPAVHYRLRNSIFAPTIKKQEKKLILLLRDRFSRVYKLTDKEPIKPIVAPYIVDREGNIISKYHFKECHYWRWRRSE